MANKPIVIAFSGGCFSGKTTTMEMLKDKLKSRGKKVLMLGELVREHKIESIDKLRENPSKYLAFQNDVISAKIDAEISLLSNRYNDVDVILVDRAITDSLFYLLFYVDKSALTLSDILVFYGLQKKTTSHINLAFSRIYDLVIEFTPIAKPCDDLVYRPKQIGALKYIESDIISMLNDSANHGRCGTLLGWDLNENSSDDLIESIIHRFKL